MPNIIAISGFAGAGKSSVAHRLFEYLPNSAHFEADALFRIKPFEAKTIEGRKKIGRIKLRNSLHVLETYLDEQFEYIIIDGLVWSQEELDAVQAIALRYAAQTHVFWLNVSTAVRHQRAVGRARDAGDDPKHVAARDVIADPRPFTGSDTCFVQEINADILHSSKVTQIIIDQLSA